MTKMVKEYVEISDFSSLDGLIDRLVSLRDTLPEEARPTLCLRGDDIFGRHLCVAYYRPQTAEEAECEARYAHASAFADSDREVCELQPRRRRLRVAA